jgi:crotonobetainyl-CoA:carnitine CoA-transferase CaiB-like acyl-CoA transferase
MGIHPLKDIRVADFTTMLNGPYTTMLLSDMGAEVIKIEPPDGDPWRFVGGGFIACNRGKRAVCLDLKKDQAKEIVEQIILESDIMVENARWGVWRRLGLDYESVVKIKPDIIYVSVLGHGSSGPLSETPGYDPLLQSRSGQSVGQGGMGQPPVFHAIPLNDMATPMLGAYGAMLGLLTRIRTGKGQHIESSLTNASIALQSGDFVDYAGIKRKYPGKPGLKGLNALHRLYEAKDNRWIFIMCYLKEHWQNLCRALNMDALCDDPKFETEEKRKEHDAALLDILSRSIKTKSAKEWVKTLAKAGVPAVMGQTGDEVIYDPHCDANDYFTQIEDPEFGPVRLPGVGPQFSKMTGTIRGHAPKLGEHTEEVLTELGYSQEQIAQLLTDKIAFIPAQPMES